MYLNSLVRAMSRTQGALYRELPSTNGVCAASPRLLADGQELSVNWDCRRDSNGGAEEQVREEINTDCFFAICQAFY